MGSIKTTTIDCPSHKLSSPKNQQPAATDDRGLVPERFSWLSTGPAAGMRRHCMFIIRNPVQINDEPPKKLKLRGHLSTPSSRSELTGAL
jgi:hypothetical protein